MLRQAQTIMKDRSDSFISQDALILALVQADNAVANAFKESGIDESKLKEAINDVRGSKHVDSKQAEQGYEALAKYAVDLTQLAEEGKLDPVIGRDNEIRRVIRVLSRRTKNNPVLIGEPGVGKSALAEGVLCLSSLLQRRLRTFSDSLHVIFPGLALRIVNRDVPANLLCRLFSLDMGALMAGASYKGEYEQRVKDVLNEVEKSEGQIIMFIDEMHLIMAGKGDSGMQASELFKPMLARGKLRCIGATTLGKPNTL